ncbi:MAG: peptidoglycan hydrolase [Micromonosporaceae bacterium]|nr:peptidoglycan hydrolase [Micromonosporaceae bacterium]
MLGWSVATVAGAMLTGVLRADTVTDTALAPAVILALPYWNLNQGTATVASNPSGIGEVSPWIYGLDQSGRIVIQYGPDMAADVANNIEKLRYMNVRIVPSLANITDGAWSYEPIAGILHDALRMRQHVADIVQLVEREDYAGIDIDYEELRAADRDAFSTFVARLADALHAKGRILSVAVFAKTTDEGSDERNVAQDYAAIGRAADQVRLMAYDYHWPTSAPGPVAPVRWVRDVVQYAKSQVADRKIMLGIPLYGYDWSGGQGRPIAWLDAVQLSRQHGVEPLYDQANHAPWFSYTDAGGQQHTVWFENRASTAAKLNVAKQAGIGGVYMWMFGSSDPGTWTSLRMTLLNGKADADSTPKGTR